MPGLPLVALFAAGAAHGQGGGTGSDARDASTAMARYQDRTRVIRPCPRGAPGEVVVCARPDKSGKRYRLPLPEERERTDSGPVRGEIPRATAAPVRAGGCGVIGGQPYGCTGGLPIVGAAMIVGKVIMGLADPDGDHEQPPPMPTRFDGAGEH